MIAGKVYPFKEFLKDKFPEGVLLKAVDKTSEPSMSMRENAVTLSTGNTNTPCKKWWSVSRTVPVTSSATF